jgi:hypothetical protein
VIQKFEQQEFIGQCFVFDEGWGKVDGFKKQEKQLFRRNLPKASLRDLWDKLQKNGICQRFEPFGELQGYWYPIIKFSITVI